jgi:hypothetical protein
MASDSSSGSSIADEEMNRQETKKGKISSEEPDVVIVVGGKEFGEYRQLLRLWSGFFDALFRSGMKESETNRIELADKDPKEWELISSIVAPFSSNKVTMDNVQIVLPWFHGLLCPQGMEQCNEAFSSPDDKQYSWRDTRAGFLQYDLKAFNDCILIINTVFDNHLNEVDMGLLQRIIVMMINHEKVKPIYGLV